MLNRSHIGSDLKGVSSIISFLSELYLKKMTCNDGRLLILVSTTSNYSKNTTIQQIKLFGKEERKN